LSVMSFTVRAVERQPTSGRYESIPAYVKQAQTPTREIRRTEQAMDRLELVSHSTEGQAFRAADDEPDWRWGMNGLGRCLTGSDTRDRSALPS
jgi:hypothetical protein